MGWDRLSSAVAWLMRGGEEHLTVYRGEDGAPPASIAYLHNLVARGLGDSYNYMDGRFVVEIRGEDRIREASLKNVATVTLQYRTEE